MQNQYEKVRIQWQEKAKTWDYKERFEALGLSGYQENQIVLKYFGKEYELLPKTGVILDRKEPQKELSFSTAMNIYHLFYYSKEKPKASNVWIPFREVARAGVFTKAFFSQTVDPFAKTFEGKCELLLKAGECLGFRKIPYSDVGFEADVYDCLSIRYLFWDGDEEFPAKANVLFDSCITDFVHEENVVMIAADGMQRLIEAAGIENLGCGYHY